MGLESLWRIGSDCLSIMPTLDWDETGTFFCKMDTTTRLHSAMLSKWNRGRTVQKY